MTQHLTDEQLILHYYGEPDSANVDGHLASCHECRDQFRKLQHVLNVVEIPVPERDADYEERVWERVAPKLGIGRRLSWWLPRQWAAAAAMAALVVAAFFAGRYSPVVEEPKTVATQQQPVVRERVLVVAVGDHLERSQMVLVELKNLPGKGKVDITGEQSLAADLLSSNRLYRQTAAAAGETSLAGVLDDLERVLVELVHSPGSMSAAQLRDIRERIENQGLLFKMRVVGSNLTERAQQPAAQNGQQL
jgi:hypothetical protein